MTEQAEASLRHLLAAIDRIEAATTSIENHCATMTGTQSKHRALQAEVKAAIADLDTLLERPNG
jgi:uncharacterized protein involved in exopolysaccharide biosynthesis